MKLIILLLIVLSTVSFLPYKRKPLLTYQLRNKYVEALLRYEGKSYAPYGETGGISCSTLVRQALIDAIDDNQISGAGIKSHPCLSEELNEGCDGELSPVLHAANLKSIDYTKVRKGDIAILGNTSGIHTLAYIGNETWIHADPIAGKVIESKEPDENDDWTTFQVNVMRWNILRSH
jgi:hypothetical protein